MYWQNLSSFFTRYWIFGVLLLIFSPINEAKTYFYYDENGQAVYSQTPPPDNRETRTIKPPPPPAEPERAHKELYERRQYFLDRKEDHEIAAEKSARDKEISGAKKENCKRAKANLSKYQTGGRRLYRDKDGAYKRHTQEKLDQLIQEQQNIIKENC